MTDYIPTDDEVRLAYIDRRDFIASIRNEDRLSDDEYGEEFDRWLAKNDAETLRTVAVDVLVLHENMQRRADLWEGIK